MGMRVAITVWDNKLTFIMSYFIHKVTRVVSQAGIFVRIGTYSDINAKNISY